MNPNNLTDSLSLLSELYPPQHKETPMQNTIKITFTEPDTTSSNTARAVRVDSTLTTEQLLDALVTIIHYGSADLARGNFLNKAINTLNEHFELCLHRIKE